MMSLYMNGLSAVLLHLLLLLTLSGCSISLLEVDEIEDVAVTGQDFVVVNFDVTAQSKSSISPDEVTVNDLNLYAFCDGKLVASDYFTNDQQPQLKLLYGLRYNLYAIANFGSVEASVDEETFFHQCEYRISMIGDMQGGLPMSWKYEDFQVTTPSDRVRVNLRRKVAKIIFSVDKSALDGLEVNAARLCQSPSVMRPFKYETGSRVSDCNDVLDGDYAQASDLQILNEGGQISFYSLENCQGSLLEGNVDPWAKVPENIEASSLLCTYLEVDCTFKDGFFYSGNVTYRLYLGMDAVSDFNVLGNSVLSVSLYLTDDALRQVSWRVESDVSVNDGYADGWLSQGCHSIDDLYVGERFVYSLQLTDEMMEHLENNPKNAQLYVEASDERVLEIGEMVEVESDGVRLDVAVLCLQSGSGTLALKDKYGKLLALFDDFVVQKPVLRVSDYGAYDGADIIQSDVDFVSVPINGTSDVFYVYLADKEGRNLNSSSGSAYDLSLFDIRTSIEQMSDEVKDVIFWQIERGQSGKGGPFLTCSLSCVNDGISQELNTELTGAVTSSNLGKLQLTECNHNLTTSSEFYLKSFPATFTLVDNGWAGYADCQLSMIVDNPSNLPLEIQCWQLNSSKDGYNAITRNEIVELYGKEFSRTVYDYVCGAYSEGQKPIYCSKSSFRSDRSELGTKAISDGDFLIYPMTELSTSAISHALIYDYMEQNALFHHISVAYENGASFDDYEVVNRLSDGTMKYNIIYGNDPDNPGWNDRGVWAYSSSGLVYKPSDYFEDLPGFSPAGLTSLKDGADGVINVMFDAESQNFTAFLSNGVKASLELNMEVEVNASGYVQTTPNGTWGKKVDNNCTARVAKQVKTVLPGIEPVAIDGNAIKEAMNAIYAQTFTDSKNMIGSANSYEHRAHPISLDIKLRFSLSGTYAMKMVPIVISAPSNVSFNHAQESVKYSVPVKTTKKLNNVAFVTKLK